MKSLKIFSFLLFFSAASIFAQTNWNLDKSHSSVGFSVTHMVITDVEGHFTNYEGTISMNGDDITSAMIDFTVDVNSINTENEDRDKHLRSDDFFNAEDFPQMSFKSKEMKKVGEKNYKLIGDLTIRDVTKEVEFDVKFNGMVNDPWGNTRAGFKATGEINRFDYGLKWNNLLETGGLVVGEDVEMVINVQLIKKA